RRGTLWRSRFKSVLVESQGEALATIAAYVDIDALRERLAEDPTQYQWCGYSQAVLGNKQAQEGLRRVVAGAQQIEPQRLSLTQALEQYQTWFPVHGEQTEGTDETAKPARAGFNP